MSGDKLFEKVKALMDYLETYPAGITLHAEEEAIGHIEKAWRIVERRRGDRRA